MTSDVPDEATDALGAALLDIERFVGHGGWDQPARLFALVRTDDVIAADAALAARLGLRGSAAGAPPDALTSIEQQDFHAGADLGSTLAAIGWPPSVQGCALCLERVFLPPPAEADIPDDPDAAARYAAGHPDRGEVRLVAGALRGPAGTHEQCVARIRNQAELLLGPELAPALAAALSETLTTPLEPTPAGPHGEESR